jgi:hypothetical protein
MHPVQMQNGKWAGAEVLLPSGYISPEGDPVKVHFDTEEECHKACDIANNYNGWNKDQANEIISRSMGLKSA